MQATYYDGVSAAREAVDLRLQDGCLFITRPDGSIERWPRREFRSSGASDSCVRIERLPYRGECVIVSGTEQVRELARLLPLGRGRGAARKLSVVVVLLAVTLLLGAGIYAAQGVVFAALAGAMPLEFEEKLGAAVQMALAPAHRRLTGRAIEDPLARMTSRLGAVTQTPYRFNVVVTKDDEVNAWAAPGGYIGVNCGLVREMASADELTAVLAHEFNHVIERHSTRNLVRTIVIRLGLSFIGGGGADSVADAAGLLGALHFMRSDEAEADRGGLDLLVRANVDPHAMARAFERLEKSAPDLPGGLRYLSSHPPTTERRRMAESVAARSSGAFQPVLSDTQYSAFRRACSTQ
jgi:predicted Zn-dependent protease